METYDIRNTQRQRAATGTEKWISTSPRMLVYWESNLPSTL